MRKFLGKISGKGQRARSDAAIEDATGKGKPAAKPGKHLLTKKVVTKKK